MPQRISVISVAGFCVADHGRGIVWEDAGHGRQVADVAADDAEEREDYTQNDPRSSGGSFSHIRASRGSRNKTRSSVINVGSPLER